MARAKKTIEIDYEPDYEIDLDEVDSDRQEAELSGEFAVPWWKPKEGRNEIRVLPPLKGQRIPYKKAFLHYNLGPIPITCPGRKTCPVCKHLGSTPDRNHPLSGSKRIFFNIIDVDNPDAGVQVWSAGNSFFKFFLDHLEDDEEWGDITHPIEGFNAIVDRKGTGLNTEYTYRFRRNESPIAEDQEEFDEFLESRFDLEKIAPESTVLVIDDLLETWLAKNPEGGSNANELEKQERKNTRKRKPKVEEPEDNEEEDEEEEEEPEPPPRRRRRTTTTKKKPKPEEEDEEEEEEEEEPEPPPKKKKSTTSSSRKKKPKAEEDEEEEEVDLDDLITSLDEDDE